MKIKKDRKDYFIEEATKKFGNRFQYNLDNFINFETEIEITDTENGETFTQAPRNHLRSKTGKPDVRFRQKNPKNITESEFKDKVKLMYGDDIEILGEFKGLCYPIKVKCNKHNIEYEAIPKNLIGGHNNCTKCYSEKLSNSSRTKKVDWDKDNSAREQLRLLINAGYTFTKIGEVFGMSGHQIGVVAKRYKFNKPLPGKEIPVSDDLLVFNSNISKKESDYLLIKSKYSKEELKKLLIKYSEYTLPNILSVEASSLRLVMKDYGLVYKDILEEERARKHKELSILIKDCIDKGYSNFSIVSQLGISQLLIETIEKEYNINPVETPKRVNVFDRDFIISCIEEGMNDIEISRFYNGDSAISSLKAFMKLKNITNPNNKELVNSYGNEYVELWFIDNNFTEYIKELRITSDKIFGRSGNGIFVDFSICLNNFTYWIEYNGRQHYEVVDRFHNGRRSSNSFLLQLKRDVEERKYCRENNITLIEIPYIFNTREKVNDFLDKVLIQHIDPNTLVNYSELYKLDSTNLSIKDLLLN